jgi:hypothetical protein
MKRVRARLRDGGRVRIEIPLEEVKKRRLAVALDPAANAPPIRRDPSRLPRPKIAPIYDAGTQIRRVLDREAGIYRDEYVEVESEGPPVLRYWDTWLWANRMIERSQATFTTDHGRREIAGTYPLQWDTQTGTTNTTLLFRGQHGEVDAAAATGAPYWRRPASIEAQRETLERWSQDGVVDGRAGDGGARLWKERLDALEAEQWGTYTEHRIHETAGMYPALHPGAYRMHWASTAFEPGGMDPARYKWTEGDTYYSTEVEPRQITVNTSRATDCELWLIPRRNRVVFQWLDMYEISFFWFGTIIYYPITRAITLRTPFLPRYSAPAGVSEDPFGASVDMSTRLALTQAYASALREGDALAASGFFHLVGRVQGRYGVWSRDLDEGALCGILRFRLGTGERTYYCWRKVRILQDKVTPLEIGPLMTDLVQPWLPFYFDANDSHATTNIQEGF